MAPTTLPFGIAPNGHDAHLYLLANASGMTVAVSDLGANLVSCRVPDGHGNSPDVLLGFSGAAGYKDDGCYLGATVGRCANRIAGARFEVAGSSYRLAANDGANNLHSGPHRWSDRLWTVSYLDDREVTFEMTSRKGDQGFPGAVQVQTTYRLQDDNTLTLSYQAIPSEPTVINLTNHAYWNLNGHASGDITGHQLQLFASTYTPLVDHIPTGEIASVEQTAYDFREARTIGSSFDELPKGYDDNFCLDNRGRVRPAARLVGDRTGISMTLSTDAPGLQLYTGFYLDIPWAKDGASYGPFAGVALEAQHYPDAIHHKHFPQPVFTPNRPFTRTISFAFGTDGR